MLFYNYMSRADRWRRSNSCIMWLMLDEASGTNANDRTSENNDGTYGAGLTLNGGSGADGRPCPRFPGTGGGADDSVHLYSAGFNSDLDADDAFYSIWAKCDSAAWTDGATRFLLHLQNTDGDLIQILKTTGTNIMKFSVKIDGVTQDITWNSGGTTAFVHYAMTISKVNNIIRYFVNGVQIGTDTFPGTDWSSSLDANYCNISGNYKGYNTWQGYANHLMICNKYLIASNFLEHIAKI